MFSSPLAHALGPLIEAHDLGELPMFFKRYTSTCMFIYDRQLYVSLGNRAHYQWLNAFCRQVTRAFRGCSVIAEGNALTVVLISLSLIMNFLMNLCAERCHCDCLVEAVSGVAGSFVSTVTYYELATLSALCINTLTVWLQIFITTVDSSYLNACEILPGCHCLMHW